MSLERLAARGERVGVEAAERARDRLIARAEAPPGINIAPLTDGIALSGKRLRHRFVTDPKLRNFVR